MKIRTDGKYELEDGRVLTPEEAMQLHKKVPEKKDPKKNPKVLELAEGESSGPIPLND